MQFREPRLQPSGRESIRKSRLQARPDAYVILVFFMFYVGGRSDSLKFYPDKPS